MNRLKTVFAIAILATMGVVALLTMDPAEVIFTVILGAVAFVGMIVAGIALVMAIGGLPQIIEHIYDRLPDRYFVSKIDPPWEKPDRLDALSNRESKANYRTLMARLDHVRDLTPSIGAGYSDSDSLMRDRETGQHWRISEEEIGFNQFQRLTPCDENGRPVDHT